MAEIGLVVLGILAGALSTLFGVGGGIVMVPLLTLAYGMDVKRAVGTSLATILPTALIGTYYHTRLGNVEWSRTVLLVLGTLLGTRLGYLALQTLPSLTLKRLFALLAIAVAVRLLLERS